MMATIKPIEDKTIHQIQSGQVIVDICSVVKELVENSLDAGASSIDVRFRNQGLDSIEVQDNGNGIPPDNYETVALKHYTSKLSTYNDLNTLQTFGFRGEALSSLCALSRLSVTTCLAKDAPRGTRLEFEISGKLKRTSITAVQKGTIVTVEGLFLNLPVRRRELEQNIKREWSKVIGVLSQYACIQTGTKISVTQQPLKGKKTTLFSTRGNNSTKDNIVNVFGVKTLTALMPLNLLLDVYQTSNILERQSSAYNTENAKVIISGHISKPISGEGRQMPDRQMFFVNKRPCGLPQIAKVFNEIYRSYNSFQSPFIFANIELDTHLYDVNVSPDKRTILLHDQVRMLASLKGALTQLFDLQDYVLPVSQPILRQRNSHSQSSLQKLDAKSEAERQNSSIRNYVNDDEPSTSSGNPSPINPTTVENNLSSGIDNYERNQKRKRDKSRSPGISSVTVHTTVAQDAGLGSDLQRFGCFQGLSNGQSTQSSCDSSLSRENIDRDDDLAEVGRETLISSKVPQLDLLGIISSRSPLDSAPRSLLTAIGSHPTADEIKVKNRNPSFGEGNLESRNKSISHQPSWKSASLSGNRPKEDLLASLPDEPLISNTEGKIRLRRHQLSPSPEYTEEPEEKRNFNISKDYGFISSNPLVFDADNDAPTSGSMALEDPELKENSIRVIDQAKVEELIKAAEDAAFLSIANNLHHNTFKNEPKKFSHTLKLIRTIKVSTLKIKSLATIIEQTQCHCQRPLEITNQEQREIFSTQTEERLSLKISKGDFSKMKIVGQFNLGFILATKVVRQSEYGSETPNDDLFIIDQHASDEIYNFERLQAITLVQSQRLVHPMTLALTAIEEEILKENISAIETNGFIVKLDESGKRPIGQRCQLLSLPLSRETAFSVNDLEELLSLLSESPPGAVPRPSKIRKMFAMRACRSSIMIGRTLTHKQMTRLVRHMGEIDKPWNCPHGRPTMRHLCALSSWDITGWKEGDRAGHSLDRTTNWPKYTRLKATELKF